MTNHLLHVDAEFRKQVGNRLGLGLQLLFADEERVDQLMAQLLAKQLVP